MKLAHVPTCFGAVVAGQQVTGVRTCSLCPKQVIDWPFV